MQAINPKMAPVGQPLLRAQAAVPAMPTSGAARSPSPDAQPANAAAAEHGAVVGDLAAFGWLLLQPNQSPLLVYKHL